VRSDEEVNDARVVRPARATRPGRGSFDSDLRPGTLNVPGIVGFGAALSLPRDEAGPAEALEKLLEGLREMKDVVRVNGSPDRSNGRIVHMTVTGGSPALRKLNDPELVSLFASKYNIMLSTGAACSQYKTGADAASHRVYGALEPGPTLRVSFDDHVARRDVPAGTA
jgi:cysteine sulfinate desulfinase/cysteine desulfurase-like protein